MQELTEIFVGLDVHKDTIAVAIASAVAVARELAGFIWAIACEVTGKPHGSKALI